MTRLRVGLILTMLIAAMFAAASLFDSLTNFGIGVAVASVAAVAYGLCDWVQTQ
jgi:hypothetical protein